MKTIQENLTEIFGDNERISLSRMQAEHLAKVVAKQVAEAVRQGMTPIGRINDRANFNIDQFIK